MAQLVYDPETGRMVNKSEIWIRQRAAQRGAENSGLMDETAGQDMRGVVERGEISPSKFAESHPAPEVDEGAEGDGVGRVPASNSMGAAQGLNTAMKSDGGAASKAGAGMMTMGAATLNPYLVGAGLAASAVGAINDKEREQNKNRYLAEVQKYNARQDAYQKLASLGAQLKA